jgi:hypothetical protein
MNKGNASFDGVLVGEDALAFVGVVDKDKTAAEDERTQVGNAADSPLSLTIFFNAKFADLGVLAPCYFGWIHVSIQESQFDMILYLGSDRNLQWDDVNNLANHLDQV